MSYKSVKTAVFPVAGLGTRVLPATKSTPKEMLTVVDRPLIHYVVEEARQAGIEHFVFVTGRGKGAIEDYFDHSVELEATLEAKGKTGLLKELRDALPKAGEISYVRQMAPLGLGHAVWCARHLLGNDPFAVVLPDVIVDAERSCLAQLVDVYTQTGGNVLAVEEVPQSETDKYGIIDPVSRDGRLVTMKGMVEKPKSDVAPSNLSITGRYILQPEIIGLLESQEKGAGGEIQLTDAMAKLLGVQPFHAYVFEGQSLDCGDKIGWLRANVALALKRPDLGAAAKAALAPFFA